MAHRHVVLLRFGAIGIAATLTYFLVAASLNLTSTLEPVGVNMIAAVISVLVSYLGHHRITYRLSGHHATHFMRFVVVTLVLYVLSSVLAWLLSARLHLAPLLITTVITLLYPVASFTLHHLWTFSVPRERVRLERQAAPLRGSSSAA